MLFTKTFALGAIAMATSVAAQSGIAFTSIFRSVNGGQVVNVTYAFGDGTPAEISLRKGQATNLGTPSVLTSSSTGGSYSWTVDMTLASGPDYALQIKQGSTVNYSPLFAIVGAGPPAVSSSSTSSSPSSSNASSASSSASMTGSRNTTVVPVTHSSTATATESASTTTTDSGSTTASSTASALSATGSATSAPKSAAVSLGVASPLALILTAVAAMTFIY